MSYIGNSPGLATRQKFRFIATSGQTVFTGADANGITLNYTPGLADIFVLGRFIPETDYTASNGSTITFSTGLNAGDEVIVNAFGAFSPSNTISLSGNGADILDKQAFRKNILTSRLDAASLMGLATNPFFEISQENGTTAVASSLYPVDQYNATKSGSGVISSQQVLNSLASTPTLKRLTHAMKTTATTAFSSYASGDYMWGLRQIIEGNYWKVLGYGTSEAQSVDFIAVVTASVSGTYTLAINNSAFNRSYITAITLVANTPTVIFKTIPGDTSGTWLNDNGAGATITFGSVTGTTFQAPTLDSWASGSYLSHASATNWAGTLNATFQVHYFNLFPNGVLPFTSSIDSGLTDAIINMRRPYEAELLRCQRYFQWVPHDLSFYAEGAGRSLNISVPFLIEMRITPAMGSVVADPIKTQTAANQVANGFDSNKTNRSSTLATISSGGAGICQLLGYRGSANARM